MSKSSGDIDFKVHCCCKRNLFLDYSLKNQERCLPLLQNQHDDLKYHKKARSRRRFLEILNYRCVEDTGPGKKCMYLTGMGEQFIHEDEITDFGGNSDCAVQLQAPQNILPLCLP